jgi:DNA-binding beta-propeller fold protein YncE
MEVRLKQNSYIALHRTLGIVRDFDWNDNYIYVFIAKSDETQNTRLTKFDINSNTEVETRIFVNAPRSLGVFTTLGSNSNKLFLLLLKRDYFKLDSSMNILSHYDLTGIIPNSDDTRVHIGKENYFVS